MFSDWTPLRDAVYTFPAHFDDIFENAADPVHFNVVHGSRNALRHRPHQIDGVTWNSWAAFEAPVHGVQSGEKKCEKCDGKGKVNSLPLVRTPFRQGANGFVAVVTEPCAKCAGTGKVRVDHFVSVGSHFQLTGIGHICVRSEVSHLGIHMRNFFYATPVDEKIVQVVVRSQVHTSAPPEVEALYYAATLRDFEADAAIWEHKARLEKPVLVPEDGPIREYRRWAAQFFE